MAVRWCFSAIDARAYARVADARSSKATNGRRLHAVWSKGSAHAQRHHPSSPTRAHIGIRCARRRPQFHRAL